jgi:vitamin B12 transporter
MLSAGARARAATPVLAVLFALGAAAPLHAEDGVPEIVVTPYFVPTAISRAGSTVTVITRERIARSSAATVADLLRSVPGLTVTESGGVGGSQLVNLRGAEPGHTLVLIDGIRVNDPASARDEFDFATFSVTDIERIEVLRGPQSALYGSDAMGGVINIITRKSGGPLRTSATVEGGSYGTFRNTLSAGGSSGPYSVFASGTYFDTHGFSRVGDRDHGEADGTLKYAGTIRGAYDPGGGFRFEYGLDGYHQASDIDPSSTVDAPGYTSNRDLLSGYGRLLFPSSDRLNNSLTFFATQTTRLFGEPKHDTDYQGADIGAEYQGVLSLGAGSLIFGTRLEQESAYQKRTDQALPAFDDARYLYAGYLLYQVPVGDRWNLSFAARHDGEIDGQGFTTGRATAVYDLPEIEARLHASIGTGAKRPTAFQLSYNPALLPEQSVGGDIGFDRTLFDGRLTVSATAFYNRFTDLINFDGDFLTGTYKNIENARTDGIELAATATIVPGVLSSTASYTYLQTEDLATGLPLQRRPVNSGKLALTYTGVRDVESTLSATLVGKRFNDNAATVVLDPYARVDFSTTYRVNDALTVFGRIENLLNANYQEVTGYNTAGLSAYVGLTWSH